MDSALSTQARTRQWAPPSPLGYHAAMQASGGIAAPLLAGFSFTMTALLLTSPSVARWQDATLALFVGAGLLLVFAVQTSLWLQSNNASPADFRDWYPDHFDGETPDDFVFQLHIDHVTNATKHAILTRWLYNLGVLALLAGVTSAVLPPGEVPTSRLVVVGVATVGLLAELIWILSSLRD